MTGIAFVTGASRGIGRETALQLARSGYDIAISARKLEGGLESTAAAIEALGRRVLKVPLDLLDKDSVKAAADQVLGHYGRIDVLVNNAIYQGEDLNSQLLELTEATLERVFRGYILGPFILTQSLLPAMLSQASGVIINITSGAGENNPPVAADQGGWGYGYGAGKAAVSRLAGIINVEHRKHGLRAYSVNPGVVATETLKATIGDQGIAALGGSAAPPSVPARVICWLIEKDLTGRHRKRTVNAQKLALDFFLTKDWRR